MKCYICKKEINSLSGNPNDWSIAFSYRNGNGDKRIYCIACVGEAINLLETIKTNKNCGNCKYMDIVVDKGSICTFVKGKRIPCNRGDYCEDWEINI